MTGVVFGKGHSRFIPSLAPTEARWACAEAGAR
jgi:hypothetical protein